MAKLVVFSILVSFAFLPIVQSSSEEAPILRSNSTGRSPKQVRCGNPSYARCFPARFICPLTCPFDCMVDCEICKPVCSCNDPGAVCQDSRFVGGDGKTFYFHGRKDADFCLVSDNDFHINAHFIGKRNPNLTRDFTWVQSIGAVFGPHKLLIAAKRALTWDAKIDHLFLALDDTSVNLPTTEGFKWKSPTKPRVSFTRSSPTNGVVVEVEGLFRVNVVVVPITEDDEPRVHGYNVTDDNCFAHLELRFKFYNMSREVDGVLGQTYKLGYMSKTKSGSVMPVMRGIHKFLSSGIFTTDCAVSRFGRHNPSNNFYNDNMNVNQILQCTSMEGTGLLCKK